MLPVFLAAVAGVMAAFAVHLVGRTRPRLLRRPNRAVTWALVLASAAGAAFAPVAPTGIDAVDVAYRAAFAGAVALAAGRARRGPRLLAGAIAAVGSGGMWPWGAVAFVALGLAAGAASVRRPARPLGTAIGALQAQVLLRLVWPDSSYATAGLAAGAALVLLVSGVRNARSHERAPAKLVLAGVTAAALASVLAVGIGLLGVQRDLVDASRAAHAGLAAVRTGETELAVAELERAQRRLHEAGDGFDAPLLLPGRLLPVIGRYLAAGQRVTEAAGDVIDPALDSARLATDDALRIRGAQVDLDAVAMLRPPLERTLTALPEARAAVAALADEALPDRASRVVDDLDAELQEAADEAALALDALDVLPRLLGADGPRRYFVVMQTPSEQRASGGLLGGYGVLVADDGRLDLVEADTIGALQRDVSDRRATALPAEYRRFATAGPEQFLQNVTNVPDFPTVARTLADLYPRSGGAPVDGVISVDPFVLSSLLSLTGPVEVAGWPQPITAESAVRVLLYDQYLELDGPEASQFLVDVIEATFDRLQSSTLPSPAQVIDQLSPHLRSNRLQLFSTHAREQALFERVGAAGAVPVVDGDFLQVVTLNNSANKIDWYQSRTISYDVVHDPATGEVDATATVAITNRAPDEGESALLIGGLGGIPGPLGRSRLTIDVYSALELQGATVDGQPVRMSGDRAFDRNLYWTVQTLGPGQTSTLQVHLTGFIEPGAPYALDVGMQPVITPDELSVRVEPAEGWEVTSVRGLEVRDGVAAGRFALVEPPRIVVRASR
ncbi:MAG: DUF4012 domain-containing protein [Acidimicrobiia bacterium]